MSVAVIYATKYGFTKKCAEILKEEISCPTDLFDLKETNLIILGNYEIVVLGTSVYAGRMQKDTVDFIENNKEKLLNKKLALFTCNMHKGDEGEKQLKEVFPEDLYNISFCTISFGGKFDFSKLNFLEKMIIKRVAHIEGDIENIEIENIKAMADKINKMCLTL